MALVTDARAVNDAMSEKRGSDRIPGLVTTDGAVAWRFLQAGLSCHVSESATFCEWGSGVGIVSCMARLLGWKSTGLEIEPRLVEISSELARRHTLDVTFIEGSYKLENAEASFDTGFGFHLFDFDVIYAYFWPAEREAMTQFVADHARPGTLFMRYGGGLDCSLFRVSE